MSYRGVLSRGFALVRDETGTPLRRAGEVRRTQRLEIEFADGKVGAIAGGRVGPPLTPPRAPAAQAREARQGRGAGVAVLEPAANKWTPFAKKRVKSMNPELGSAPLLW